MITSILLATILIVGLAAVYKKLLYRKRREGEPEIVPGHFFWGNAKQFNENAIDFLHKARKKLGNIFTIRLLNKHMTIIMDPHSLQAMSREKKFDFDPIQRQVNMNVFHFKLVDAKSMLKETAKTVRGEQLGTGMRNFHQYLMESIDSVSVDSNMNITSDVSDWQTRSMRDFSAETLFYSIFTTIFGRDPTNKFQPLEIYRTFDTFHKYFNFLWLGVPLKLFPEAGRAFNVLADQPTADELLLRPDLSDYIRGSIEFMKAHNQTESDIIGHSLVYLHVNYNSFRLAYWCMYNLMKYKQASTALTEEIDNIVKSKTQADGVTDDTAIFTTADVEDMPVLDSLIKETIRLTSGAFVVRYVNEDCDFKMDNGNTYTCRKGDRVAFYPPALHKDPEVFEKPMEFHHDRFIDAEFQHGGKTLKSPVVGFGTLCPGKRYAMLQIKWFLIAMTYMFDLQLAEGETTECDIAFHGHEVLPPTRDVNIHFRRKNLTRPTLCLI